MGRYNDHAAGPIRYNLLEMNNVKAGLRRLGEFNRAEWVFPATILAVCVFCFGILFARLGFFQDDWHHVFYAYWQGAPGLQSFLLTDRGPFAWIVYGTLFKILGFAPGPWHWFLMLVRFMTAFVFWLSLRQIWPDQSTLATWLALIFAVYPIFTLQPLAVAYSLHWLMYLVFMLSLAAMLIAVRRPNTFLPLTIIAIALAAVHLVFIEYFSGLELSRPIFLWLILADLPARQRWKATLRRAAPYLLLLAAYVLYRSSYAGIFGYDRFTPLATLNDLFHTPLETLRGVAQSMLQDIVYVVLSSWNAAVDPAVIDLARPSTLYILGGIVAAAGAVYLVFTQVDRRSPGDGESRNRWPLALCGLASIVLALLPFWLTGFSVYQKNLLWSERLALAAMPGASMLVVGAVYAVVDRSTSRHLILSVLLGLAVGLQIQTARSYQASWDKQRQFYWQLHWRAPALQRGTLVVADQEILFYMGIYPTAYSINLLYPQVTLPPLASYWFNAGFEHVNFDNFASGQPTTFQKYASTFTATIEDVLAITFEPGQGQCLWILGPRLQNARNLTAQASTWLAVSNPGRILAAPAAEPPSAIFGVEPAHTWCYYFEQADLASQFHEWRRVAQLWEAAIGAGKRAENGIEMMPFITAFGHLDEWDTAIHLTAQAQALPDRSTSALCDLWRSLGVEAPSSAERDQAVAQVEAELACQR